MFFGEYKHQLDAKNRIRVPAKLKVELGNKYFLSKGVGSFISVYPASKMDKLASDMNSISSFDREAQMAVADITASFIEVEEDNQGRIILPDYLREYAGIKKDVVTIGVFDRIDIWDAESWQARKSGNSFNRAIDVLNDRTKK